MVYVDALLPAAWCFKKACHLYADDVEQLHAFAQSIGLKRKWFQNKTLPHYDLTENKRQLAMDKGAFSITKKQVVEWIRRSRHPLSVEPI